MIQKIKKPVSILLVFMMIVSLFTVVPITASAAETTVTDTLMLEDTGRTGVSYGEWSNVTKDSDAVYAGNSAGGNNAIQLRSTNNSGIITTASGGNVRKITVTWNDNTTNGRTLRIYGRNTAYSSASELQGDYLGVITYGESTELTVSGDYAYIGIRSASGALYLDEVQITWAQPAPAPNPAKLILNVGENGKVVMNNGTFGNFAEAGIIENITSAFSINSGAKIFILDGNSVNVVEGGSINIATGGELSFYPSADNTGVITAIPAEGYVFSGWYNGETRYSTDAALAYQNIGEEMTLTAKFAPKLFVGHSLTLRGDIGVNFFIDPAAVGADIASAESATVSFSVDKYNSEVDLKTAETRDGLYIATCYVPAAYMAHDIHAEVTINGVKQNETDDYSVQDYAETIIADPAAYTPAGKSPEALSALVKEMLNYGAKAQGVFSGQMNAPADYHEIPEYTMGDVTTELIDQAIAAANNGATATDMSTVHPEAGANYYTTSLIFLSKSTLRHYFAIPGGSANPSAYDGSQSDYYYNVDVVDIPAKELDTLQEFKVNDTTFYYSALDYAKAVLNSNMGDNAKALVSALYLYNQAANAYFDAAPAPVENVVDLSKRNAAYEAQDGDVLTGELIGNYQITVAAGATVTLRNVDITSLSNNNNTKYAGITPLGDATIILEGTNTVKGGYEDYPGIYAAENAILTIKGDGSLDASSNGYGCGIGGGFNIACGNIAIEGGTISAAGGTFATGIGGGVFTNCGAITISGGTVTATGGYKAAGIGSGCQDNNVSTCGDIKITGGTVTANGGTNGAGIGSGEDASCGNITISGGTTEATGGVLAAGIGSGYRAHCGTITIQDTVTKVTATKGAETSSSIGAGLYGFCGTITIGGVVKEAITQNPYTYPA